MNCYQQLLFIWLFLVDEIHRFYYLIEIDCSSYVNHKESVSHG